MKLSLLLLIAGIATGCATAPVELPEWSHLERVPETAPMPTELPDLETDFEGNVTATSLKTFLIVAEANTAIAAENGEALAAQSAAYNELVTAGQHQRDYARIREEQLESERREHWIDNWFHRAVIVLMGLGYAL